MSGSIPPPIFATLDKKLESEKEFIDAMLNQLARGTLEPDMWNRLHAAAARDGRQAELAMAYEGMAGEKRLQALAPPLRAEALYRASVFFHEQLADEEGELGFLERALKASPTHEASTLAIRERLLAQGSERRLADIWLTLATHRMKPDSARMLKEAARWLVATEEDRAREAYVRLLKIDPTDDEARLELADLYVRKGAFTDIIRIFEQRVNQTDPAPSVESSKLMRTRLVEAYDQKLGETERATPHIEILLALDPTNVIARNAAKKLLVSKGMRLRAAFALGEAAIATREGEEALTYLMIEMESTRGAKRVSVLKRVALVSEELLGDLTGAYDAMEQALTGDPSDDEARIRLTLLAMKLGRQLDAAKLLVKAQSSAKDPAVRARLAADVGDLFWSGGDFKRAKASFLAALGTPDVPEDVQRKSLRGLCALADQVTEVPELVTLLERLVVVENEPERLLWAHELLARMAYQVDASRAIPSLKYLITIEPYRAQALEALEALYRANGNTLALAETLFQRAELPETPDGAALLLEAADLFGPDPRAARVLSGLIERNGPSREVFARLLPILEKNQSFEELALALEQDATLAEGAERAEILTRAATLRLAKLRDTPRAIELYAEALAVDPSETRSRSALEKLMAAGEHRAAAARALEPIVRREGAVLLLARALEVSGQLAPSLDERLRALEEGAMLAISDESVRPRGFHFVSGGLRESLAAGYALGPWMDRIEPLITPGDAPLRAELLGAALGTREIESEEVSRLACVVGEAYRDAGEPKRAADMFRRALRFDPTSSELLGVLDELLREDGTPEERAVLFRDALARTDDSKERQRLQHRLGHIEWQELSHSEVALEIYRSILTEHEDDSVAFNAVGDLLGTLGRIDEQLHHLLERSRIADGSPVVPVLVSCLRLCTEHRRAEEGAPIAQELLALPNLSESDLETVVLFSRALKLTDLELEAAKKRADAPADPATKMRAFEDLGELQSSAKLPAEESFARAAEFANELGSVDDAERLLRREKKCGGDTLSVQLRLVALLTRAERWFVLADELSELASLQEEEPEIRKKTLLELAAVRERVADDKGAMDAFTSIILLDPKDASTFSELLRVAEKSGLTERLEEELVRIEREAKKRLSPESRDEILLLRARISRGDADKVRRIMDPFRKRVSGETEAHSKMVLAFSEWLDTATGIAADDHRWLYERRIELVDEPAKVQLLLEWARKEEATFGDKKKARALFRQVLTLDADQIEAESSVLRLELEAGDLDAALELLASRKENRDDEGRRRVELEIAELLISRKERLDQAYSLAVAHLDRDDGDTDAIRAFVRLAAFPEYAEKVRTRLVEMVERLKAQDAPVELRRSVLRALLKGTPIDANDERALWHRELIVTLGPEAVGTEAHIAMALEAARDCPVHFQFWDLAEENARRTKSPDGVADAYLYAIFQSELPLEELRGLAERAVAFLDEWFEDASRSIRVLEHVTSFDPGEVWAFERLKSIYDSRGEWDKLFALVDRALAVAAKERVTSLLEDAAHIAKDFASAPDRAIQYFERLHALKPNVPRVFSSLERLYERQGRTRELIALLLQRLPLLPEKEAQENRVRIADLYMDRLTDPTSALLQIEEILASDPRENPTLSVLGEATAKARLTVVALLERILRESSSILASDEPVTGLTEPPDGGASKKRGRVSLPPPRSRAKRIPTQHRAAALLREHYSETGRDAELASVLEIELGSIKSIKEQIRRHKQVAEIRERLGDQPAALEHYVALVTLEPDVVSHREALAALARTTGRFDKMAEVLATAGEDCTDDDLRVELLMAAAQTYEEELKDAPRAIDLYLRVLLVVAASEEVHLAAARRLEPLLYAASRLAERLDVLERMSHLEREPAIRKEILGTAAMLAVELGQFDRAVYAWEARISEDKDDTLALDGLVEVHTHTGRHKALISALERRSDAAELPERKRADRIRVADIQESKLRDEAAAIDVWRSIERTFGASEEGTAALERLYVATERWDDLATHLGQAAHRETTPTKAAILARLGDVERQKLRHPEKAVQAYHDALQVDVMDEAAVRGLRAYLRDEETQELAVTELLAALRVRNDFASIVELTNDRLDVTSAIADKVAVLEEAATLAETSLSDEALAFEFAARAFLLAPERLEAEDRLLRLAERTARWTSVVDVFRKAVDALDVLSSRPGELISHLRLRLGEVLEGEGDRKGALASYMKAVVDTPRAIAVVRAVVRTAGANDRWDAAANSLIDYLTATREEEESLFSTLLETAREPAHWAAMASAFADAVRERPDLSAPLARDLEARIAVWHHDHRKDPERAEEAYERALRHDPQNATLLSALTGLQRRSKGRPLVDSLLRLSQSTGGDLDLLREAAEVAMQSLGDWHLSKSLLERLFKLGVERWLGREEPSSVLSGTPANPETYVAWATTQLTHIFEEEKDGERWVAALLEAARLPFATAEKRAMRIKASSVAVDLLDDSDRGITILSGLFDENHADEEVANALSELLSLTGRKRDLHELLGKRIAVDPSVSNRLEFRLVAAALDIELGRPDSAVELLRTNLREGPGHRPSALALADVLVQLGRTAELVTLYADQARIAEMDRDVPRIVEFYSAAARVAEDELSDLPRAIEFHLKILNDEKRADSYDALARLSRKQKDAQAEARYLEELLTWVLPEKLEDVTLRLVEALLASSREDDALARLRSLLDQQPAARRASALLVEMHRRRGEHRQLAELYRLIAGVAETPGERVARLREASLLLITECADPAAAVPLLQEVVALEPGERSHRFVLADALGAAGHLDEARGILRVIIDEFGGRRPKERAPVHFHLAKLDLRASDPAQALVELEAATKIDPSSIEILRALAELARDRGELERAERSYRAILSQLRRYEDSQEEPAITKGEIFFELSEIASKLADADRAMELLESAIETAATSPVEARRLEALLNARERFAPLAKVMRTRIVSEESSGIRDRAGVGLEYARLAELVFFQLSQAEEGTSLALRAVEVSPEAPQVHETLMRVLSGSGSPNRYLEAMESLAQKAEAARNGPLAATLLYRVAKALDPASESVIEYLERAERLGDDSPILPEVVRALSARYREAGRSADEARVLMRLLTLEESDGSKSQLLTTLIRLADLRIQLSKSADDICDVLDRALVLGKSDGTLGPLVESCRALVALHPTSARAVGLFEDVARAATDDTLLLEALRHYAGLGKIADGPLREAIELAKKLGDVSLQKQLLERLVSAPTDDAASENLIWGLLLLAQLETTPMQALTHRRRAAGLALPSERAALLLEIADDALPRRETRELSRAIYEELLFDAPTDERVWKPLLEILKEQGDLPKQMAILSTVLDGVSDPKERGELRKLRTEILLSQGGDRREAREELTRILEEDPSADGAADLLAKLCEEDGDEAGLLELLKARLDAARDRGDGPLVAKLTERMVRLVEKTDPERALEMCATGLEWEPGNRSLLQSVVSLVRAQGDAYALADALERLLASLTGPTAEPVARELIALREGDVEAIERAEELGFKANPAPGDLADRLVVRFESRGDHPRMVSLYEALASGESDAARRATLLADAAKRAKEQLGDAPRAIKLLKQAREIDPSNVELLVEHVKALVGTHELESAAGELSAALSRHGEGDPSRARLLSERATVRRLLGDDGGALYDTERAYTLDRATYGAALIAQLQRMRNQAQSEPSKRTSIALRLADVMRTIGQLDEAAAAIAGVLASEPDNQFALRSYAELAEAKGDWDNAANAYQRLVNVSEGATLAEMALRLATICEKAGDLWAAKEGLEKAFNADRTNPAVRVALGGMYERYGEARGLAMLAFDEAEAVTDPAQKVASLLRGATILLERQENPDRALTALEEARSIRPTDLAVLALMSDALVLLDRAQDASTLLSGALQSQKGRRSKELAPIYYRLGLFARSAGQRPEEMQYFSTALDMDLQNGVIASELASVGLELGNFDVAIKALRAITMLKVPGPVSKGLAYQRLGEIALHQGDPKKAMLLLKRATDEDPTLDGAKQLFQQISGRPS